MLFVFCVLCVFCVFCVLCARTANTKNRSSLDFFARPNRAPRSSCASTNLSRSGSASSSCTRHCSYFYSQIHFSQLYTPRNYLQRSIFLNRTPLDAHSTSGSLSTLLRVWIRASHVPDPCSKVPSSKAPSSKVPCSKAPCSKVPSSIVNPIIQSTSHPTAGTRFWCHLCPSKVPGDTAGPWEPTIDGLWRSTMGSTFLDNGFHLQNPNNCFRERDPMGRVCGLMISDLGGLSRIL